VPKIKQACYIDSNKATVK